MNRISRSIDIILDNDSLSYIRDYILYMQVRVNNFKMVRSSFFLIIKENKKKVGVVTSTVEEKTTNKNQRLAIKKTNRTEQGPPHIQN